MDATQALQALKDGNRRFVEQSASWEVEKEHDRRLDLLGGQSPFAIVLGCSDSRVPAELIFDQGVGDLFVIRIAGNIVARSQIGSIEFAAQNFGTRLVVVLGHSGCGAVKASLDALEGADTGSPNVGFIVDQIRPGLEALHRTARKGDDLMPAAVRRNVENSVEVLRHQTPALQTLIRDEGLQVVGAEYLLETGEVRFHDHS